MGASLTLGDVLLRASAHVADRYVPVDPFEWTRAVGAARLGLLVDHGYGEFTITPAGAAWLNRKVRD